MIMILLFLSLPLFFFSLSLFLSPSLFLLSLSKFSPPPHERQSWCVPHDVLLCVRVYYGWEGGKKLREKIQRERERREMMDKERKRGKKEVVKKMWSVFIQNISSWDELNDLLVKMIYEPWELTLCFHSFPFSLYLVFLSLSSISSFSLSLPSYFFLLSWVFFLFSIEISLLSGAGFQLIAILGERGRVGDNQQWSDWWFLKSFLFSSLSLSVFIPFLSLSVFIPFLSLCLKILSCEGERFKREKGE